MLEMKKDISKDHADDAASLSLRGRYYPNELGRVHMSINKMQVIPIEAEYVGDAMARERRSKKDNSVQQNVDQKAIDDIWKHLGLGHIDISYACVGYSMDGRPILNHDEFVNLLINYGFKVTDVVPFIEEFAKHGEKDNKSPIVMFTANTSAIMTSIEPIV